MEYINKDESNEYLLFAIQSAGIGVWNLDPINQKVWVDERCRELFGFEKHENIPFHEVLKYIHPEDKDKVEAAILKAVQHGSTGKYQIEYRLPGHEGNAPCTVSATGQAYFNAQGTAYRFSGVVRDITDKVNLRVRAAESKQIAGIALESAEMGWIKMQVDSEAIETSALFLYHYTGLAGAHDFTRKDLLAYYHPDDISLRDSALVQLRKSGKLDLTARLVWVDNSVHWIRVSGKYTYDTAGNPTYLFATSQDITPEKEMFDQIAASEEKFRSVIAAAPAAMGLFVGRDLIVQNPNQAFIDIVGKGPDITNKPLREVMPELLSEGQPFLKLLDDVYTTGKTYQSYGDLVKIVQQGVMTYNYYNITYSPVYDNKGEVWAILDIAVDVTGEILLRKQLEGNEKMLRSAIEVAELAVWSVELPSGRINISEDLRVWLGMPENATVKESFKLVQTEDRSRVEESLKKALSKPGEIFDEEFAINAIDTRGKKIIHIQGRAEFDTEGKPAKLTGIARDITPQRQLQLELEDQVKQRTASLAVRTDELAESNLQLTKSNQELSQFAYVASHDLQEPLRKIKVFSNMLSPKVGEDGVVFLDKITSSADRMSLLITDLLNFSGLLNSDSLWTAVNLNTVMRIVRKDFELIIEEKNARIHIGELPVVQGINVQLTQLFYNLMSNALKFSQKEKAPEITVISMKMTSLEAANFLEGADPATTYHCISFSDNGIGFEAEYSERIFDIFKRLHGRAEYAGSGIGLALCKRIITNHGGHIYAQSKVGESATFYIVLPEKSRELANANS